MEILKNPGKDKRILFVGEGNFSFSRHLTENWDLTNLNVLATCYESKPSDFAKENIQALEASGVEIKLDFDATKISEQTEKCFDVIIFMFPHVGGKMKINKNRELLKQFGISASNILKNNSSQLIITLCDGQGGTPFDKIQRKDCDSWQIVKMLSYSQLGLTNVDKFSLDLFPNYKSFGYRSLEKSFHTDQGTIHVFAKQPIDTRFLYSVISLHDMSFWLPKSAENQRFELSELSEIIKEISDGLVIETKVVDKFFCGLKNLHSQTIRLTYFDDKNVQSPDEIMKLHYKIGDLMSEKLDITVR